MYSIFSESPKEIKYAFELIVNKWQLQGMAINLGNLLKAFMVRISGKPQKEFDENYIKEVIKKSFPLGTNIEKRINDINFLNTT